MDQGSKSDKRCQDLGELCGSVNPRQELICLALYYQGLFLFSNQILVI